MNRRKKLKLTGLLAALALVGLLGFRTYNAHRFHLEKETRFLMDTYVTIYAAGPREQSQKAIADAFHRMGEVDRKFSVHNPESPLYAFNTRGEPVTDPEILAVVEKALLVSRQTDGAFDITISPLADLWGFYSETEPALPGAAAIRERLDLVDYRQLSLENGRLEKSRPEIRIDLGGIAKGHAVAEAAKVLQKSGIESALIDAGGDVYAMGDKGNGQSWKVGLRNPRGEELLGYVDIEDISVMGSGDYERYFEEGGRRYHHILDPRTGYPARGAIAVNLFHPDPMMADAYCTAVFVLGPEQGPAFVEKMGNMEMIMMTGAGERLLSSGLEDGIRPLE